MRTIVLAVCASLAACGGGGGTSEAPTAAPQAIAPACVPRVASVHLLGDSTQVAMYQTGALQRALDARYGAGAVIVTSTAVGGTTSTQLRGGTDGRNAWPVTVDADVVLVNHGINDEYVRTPMADYAGNYRDFAGIPGIVFETPNPIGPTWGTPAYAATVRSVGAETHTAVADVEAYVLAIADPFAGYAVDHVHPGPALDELIARDVLVPAIAPLINPARCL